MNIVCSNKSANFEYFLLDTFKAGIVLLADEIKSVRAGHMSLKESFVIVKKDEVWLKNAFIANYENAFSGKRDSLDTRRDRKLLLNKHEIKKLSDAKAKEGLTIVPTKAYFDRQHLKIEIAIAKGKKLYDKRETIKQRELTRKENAQLKSTGAN